MRRCAACGVPRGDEYWACVQWCDACLDEFAATTKRGSGEAGITAFLQRKKAEREAAWRDGR